MSTAFQVHWKAGQCYICRKGGKKRIVIHHEMIHTLMKRRSKQKNQLIGAEQPQWDEHRRVDKQIFFSGSSQQQKQNHLS